MNPTKEWFDGRICVYIESRCTEGRSCGLKHVQPHSIKTICFSEITNGFCPAPHQCIYDQHDSINLVYHREAVKYTKDWYYGKLCGHLGFRCNAQCNRIHANPNTVLVSCEWERKTNKCKNPKQCIYAFHKNANVGKYGDWFQDIGDVVVANDENKYKLYEYKDNYNQLQNDIDLKTKELKRLKQLQSQLNGNNNNNEDEDVNVDHVKAFKKWYDLKLQLPEYYNKFIEAGFDSLLAMQRINNSDLIALGIEKKGHRIKILEVVKEI